MQRPLCMIHPQHKAHNRAKSRTAPRCNRLWAGLSSSPCPQQCREGAVTRGAKEFRKFRYDLPKPKKVWPQSASWSTEIDVSPHNRMSHKFHVGQLVEFRPKRGWPILSARGAYETLKQLPERDGELQYRIKSAAEEHERRTTGALAGAKPC